MIYYSCSRAIAAVAVVKIFGFHRDSYNSYDSYCNRIQSVFGASEEDRDVQKTIDKFVSRA